MRRAMAEALGGLVRYPLRSALALLGLAVGVASVVATLALLDAAHRQGVAVLEKEGALDVVRLTSPEGAFRNGRWTDIPKRARLGPADVEKLRRAIPWIEGAMLGSGFDTKARSGAVSQSVAVRGTGADGLRFLSLRLQAGRFLDRGEEERGDKVAVLSGGFATDLFDSAGRAPGREILIADQRFVVVGVLVPVKDDQGNEPAVCYVPFRAAMERLGSPPLNVVIHLAAGRRQLVGPLESAVRAVLPILHSGLEAGSYEVESSREALSDLETAERTQAAILGGVAAFSILVAASGILNTLLVGVRERTREIGTRRALGARRRSVLLQFLFESVFLSVPGAALGLGLGVLLTGRLAVLLGRSVSDASLVAAAVGTREALVAAGVSVLVAVGAGLWPAWEAARVEPAEALRHD